MKECDILAGQNIPWSLLHIFSGVKTSQPAQDLCPRRYLSREVSALVNGWRRTCCTAWSDERAAGTTDSPTADTPVTRPHRHNPEISFGGGTRRRRRRGRAPQARGPRRRRRRGGGVWGVGVPLLTGGWVWEGAVSPPQKFFQYCIIKLPVLVDSDVLHVLLIVVVKLETCT